METRFTDPAGIDTRKIGDEIASGRRVIVQFSRPGYDTALLSRLNALAAEFGPSLEIRFYGHYGGTFDASILQAVPDARAVAVDCLQRAENLETLSQLRNLRSLSIGAYEGMPRDLLGRLHLENVERLILDTCSPKRLSLEPLSNAGRLRELCVNGQTKGIRRIAGLPVLEELTLRSMPKKQSLDFVSGIARLRRLEITLGGRENIREIEHPRLERLAIILVRGFSDLENLPAFPALRNLHVEDEPRLESIRFQPGNEALENLRIVSCKKLVLLEGLHRLANLRELRLAGVPVDMDALLAAPLPPRLEAFAVYTGGERRNRALRERLDALGYRESL